MLLAGFALSLSAALFVPMSIQAMAERSQLIVRGTVLSQSCQQDDAGRIYTKVELKVAEVWQGQVSGDRLTIVHGGGVLGRRKVAAAGQVEYRIGEEVVAFLVLNPRGEAVTLGMCQGKFHVWTDPVSGRKRARNPFHGGEGETVSIPGTAKASDSAEPLTVDALKQQVMGAKR
ncbi:MAG: hypothetical protein KGS61_22240 [Verrucomicrobia bacterium]|nr:hypothetical protein [Verrucomicrobiota bacterium]